MDDEEWVSAVLPSRAGKPGRIAGDIVIGHFSYFTQERGLLGSYVLNKYYQLAGLPMDPSYSHVPKETFEASLRRWLINRVLGGEEKPDIRLLDGSEVPAAHQSKIPAAIFDPNLLQETDRTVP